MASVRLTHFIADILTLVDNLTANFVKTAFEAITQNWLVGGLLDSLLTLYVLHFLYQMKYQDLPFSECISHLIKVCIVFTLCTNWNVFYLLIFNVATNEPLHIATLLVHGAPGEGVLSTTFAQGIEQAMLLLGNMPMSLKGSLCALFAAGLLIFATFLFTLFALSLLVLVKFYLAVYLALAPYFIMMSLFGSTRGLSESWVKACLNKALIPVFVGCILLLTTKLATFSLSADSGFANNTSPDFVSVVLYVFSACISAYLLKTVPEKAASLTASLAMAGASQIARHAQNLSHAPREVGSRLKQGVQGVKRDFQQRQQNLQQEIRQRAQVRQQKAAEARDARARSCY